MAVTGILGGAFDPPHVGHVALARAAVEHFGLERLLVLVVEDPGHKRTATPAETRLELVRLALEDVPGVEVELDPHARTVDSLEERRPEDAVFVLGADELADFPTWKRPERVLELVRLGVAMRPGVPERQLEDVRARLPAPGRIEYFEMEPMAVSSTEIRDRLARGESIEGLVPPRVADEIARLGLYATAE
jgi:nicotinate-nucleotide adenylyltransferase